MNVIPCKAVGFFNFLCCEKHCIQPGENRKLNLYCSKTNKTNQPWLWWRCVRIFFFFFLHRGGSRLDDIEWLYWQWLNPTLRGLQRWLKPAFKIFSLFWVHPAFSESLLPKILYWCSYYCLLKDDKQLLIVFGFFSAVRDDLLKRI